ncbi:hypothetical protein DRQ25_08395 [Candidatus Fermentibacteria bacterium]|nr:MAG: hypothetical protein DRQ25_08395 [Candidatus Fermentibacteria bacterium]
MNKMTRLMTVCAALLLIVPAASADWSENFDSYALNSGLIGQGGWDGWEGAAAADAFVTDTQVLTAPHALASIPTTDIVQEFNETSGDWTMTGHCYIPSGSTGKQYFIMLNIYGVGVHNWSVQVEYDSDGGIVTDYYSSSVTSLINDAWVEVRAEIHLDINVYDLYYNDVFLASNAWQDGSGVNEIAALDIFSDGGSTIYWDDFTLIYEDALQHTTWGHIKTLMQ